MLIPPVNIVFEVIIIFDLAKVFGKDSSFALGLLFFAPIFVPILTIGASVYTPMYSETRKHHEYILKILLIFS
jgi:hypothetical protein